MWPESGAEFFRGPEGRGMKIFLLIILICLMGCGNLKRWASGITGDPSEYCYKGVKYLQFPSGATVAFDQDGKVSKCQ